MSRLVLVSIHPQHVSNILNGSKVFEYRKILPSNDVSQLAMYCTAPVKKIIAIAEVMDCLVGSPSRIWTQTAYGSGISRQFFRDYFSGHRSANAFVLGNVYKMTIPIDLNELSDQKTPPQSFCYLSQADMEEISKRKSRNPERPSSMVFVGGIHGVGKSTICQRTFGPLGYQCEEASSLIAAHGREITNEKRVRNVSDNQVELIGRLKSVQKRYCRLVLDGHFTLINDQGKIEPIDPLVFEDMNPSRLILIKGDAAEISKRLTVRDGKIWGSSFLEKFQKTEEEHARHVSDKIQVPLLVFHNTIKYSRFAKAIQRSVLNDCFCRRIHF